MKNDHELKNEGIHDDLNNTTYNKTCIQDITSFVNNSTTNSKNENYCSDHLGSLLFNSIENECRIKKAC